MKLSRKSDNNHWRHNQVTYCYCVAQPDAAVATITRANTNLSIQSQPHSVEIYDCWACVCVFVCAGREAKEANRRPTVIIRIHKSYRILSRRFPLLHNGHWHICLGSQFYLFNRSHRHVLQSQNPFYDVIIVHFWRKHFLLCHQFAPNLLNAYTHARARSHCLRLMIFPFLHFMETNFEQHTRLSAYNLNTKIPNSVLPFPIKRKCTKLQLHAIV